MHTASPQRGARRRVLIALGVGASCLAATSPAHADTGGMSADGTPATGAAVAAPAPTGGLAITGDPLVGTPLTASGSFPGLAAGTAIAVQQLQLDGSWTQIAGATTQLDGSFTAGWTPTRAGRQSLRAVPATSAGATARAASGTSATLTVFRAVTATWFGPGFYGRKTACGQRMSKKLLGVAHKTLPCGTQVAVYYEGRTVTVPVVDRGPFRKGTSYDLTRATADAVGFTDTDTIGAVSVRKPVAR